MANNQLRWGLLGASNVAREWMVAAMNGHADSQVVSVYSRDPDRGETFRSEFGLQVAHTDLTEFLTSPDINAVYISTTNERHAEEAIAAARAGKHILCEKPLALDRASAVEMIEAAKAAGIVLATNHHLRNQQTHRAIRDVIRSGKLGKITSIQSSFTVGLPDALARWRLHDPALGAGVILDLTVHEIDLLRFYLNAEPIAVSGTALTSGDAPKGVADNAVTIWEFPGDLLATCHDSFLVPFGGTSIAIHGTEGSIHGQDVLWQAPGGEVIVRTAAGDRTLEIEHRIPYDRTIADFVSAVWGGGKASATAEDGLRSLDLALWAQKAITSGMRQTF